jgi:DNA-binding MarR family transcriptional regulator
MTPRGSTASPIMWSDAQLLSTAARLWEYTLNRKLKELDLTLAGLVALQALHAAGTTSQAALARIIRVQPQTLRRTLRSLEESGYLTNSAPTPGSRGLNISITTAGKLMLSEADDLEQRSHRTLNGGGELHNALVTLIESLTAKHPADQTPAHHHQHQSQRR